MPGVLMIEGCAQVAGMLLKSSGWDPQRFTGLASVDKARFRGVVTPPGRIHFVAVVGQQTESMASHQAQAFVDDKLVLDMSLTMSPLVTAPR